MAGNGAHARLWHGYDLENQMSDLARDHENQTRVKLVSLTSKTHGPVL